MKRFGWPVPFPAQTSRTCLVVQQQLKRWLVAVKLVTILGPNGHAKLSTSLPGASTKVAKRVWDQTPPRDRRPCFIDHSGPTWAGWCGFGPDMTTTTIRKLAVMTSLMSPVDDLLCVKVVTQDGVV